MRSLFHVTNFPENEDDILSVTRSLRVVRSLLGRVTGNSVLEARLFNGDPSGKSFNARAKHPGLFLVIELGN
jgi:hypothetical protein